MLPILSDTAFSELFKGASYLFELAVTPFEVTCDNTYSTRPEVFSFSLPPPHVTKQAGLQWLVRS